MSKIYETRTITSKTKDGSERTLLVHIRTQYDENIHMISLEVKDEPNLLRVNWKHPFQIHKKMVDILETIIDDNPWILEKLWFEAIEPSRARLNARAFKNKGYQVYHEFNDFYSIRKNITTSIHGITNVVNKTSSVPQEQRSQK